MIHFGARKNQQPLPMPAVDTFLLFSSDSTNGDRLIVDESPEAQIKPAITPYGTNIYHTTTGVTPKFGTSMIYFSTAGLRRTVAPQSSIKGDFTVEAWIQGISYGTQNTILSTADGTWVLYVSSLRALKLSRMSTVVLTTADSIFVASAWNHVTWMRLAGVQYLYINGVQRAGPYTDTAALNVCGVTDRIGASSDTANYFACYVDGFRISRSAVYTVAGFTPPIYRFPAPAIYPVIDCNSYQLSNRLLITTPQTHGTSTLVNESAASLITPVMGGTAKWSNNALLFSGSTIAVTLGEDGGISFPITNDCFLTTTRAFTVEFYFKATSFPTGGTLFHAHVASGSIWAIKVQSTGTLTISENTTVRLSAGTIPLDTWVHIAWTRTTAGVNAIYINGVSSVSTYTNTAQAVAPSTGYTGYFGTLGAAAGGAYGGYFAQIRIIYDVAMYTGTTAVPAYPTAALRPATVKYEKDPLFWVTSFLLASDGVSESQVIVDEGVGNATITPSVGCKYTTNQAKFGTTSIATGAGGLGWTASFYGPVSSPCTIEMWIYVTSYAFGTATLWTSSTGWTLTINASGLPILSLSGTPQLIGDVVIPLSQWVHVALDRNSSNVHHIFVNGVDQIATYTSTTVLGNFTSTHRFCGLTSTTNPMPGYLGGARITAYFNRYPAAFTPPTIAFPTQ